MFSQDSNTVLVRTPGNRQYNKHSSFGDIARELWEYAALCENSYLSTWENCPGSEHDVKRKITNEPQILKYANEIKGAADYSQRLNAPGWQRWTNFPSEATIAQAEDTGLYVEIMQNRDRIAIVFRGTEFTSWRDWKSNLRWFRVAHLLPFVKDQYTVIAETVGKEFVDAVIEKQLQECEIIVTGHSLGGGLAQHLAYSLPSKEAETKKPIRVAKVCTFDPSPVTGWSTAGPSKHDNAKDLHIDRAFEHGEALAYIRLLISYVYPPPAYNPSVREIRFNVVKTTNPFRNHSMRLLAVALMREALKISDIRE
jgi:pimeloyl-ACP methyl ester carboxylesterase